MKKDKFKEILFIILIIIFSIGVIPKYFQNDTLFTIAVGQRTIEYGIEEEDQLVWHDGLHFIHLRWAFDVLITEIYNVFGFIGIYVFVIIVGIIISLMYYFIAKYITKKSLLSFIATIITMYIVGNNFIAARAQIISYIVFLLEFICIEKLLETNRKKYFIILMFLPIVLANFHASVYPVYFVMYLPYIAEFILSKFKVEHEESKIIIEKTSIKTLIIVMILGSILGFCSPIGIEAYTYMFKVMSGISIDFIAELQPVNLLTEMYFSILIILTIALTGFTKVKIRARDGFFIIGFLILAMPTYRCLVYFYLISTICILRIISDFIDLYNINEFVKKQIPIIKKVVSVLAVLCIVVFSVSEFTKKLSADYVKSNTFPIDAVDYILENIDVSRMRIYNGFNYGSYLEFRKIPVFIDSRSEIYTPEFNENCYILNDYYDTIYGLVNYRNLFKKYGITHALLENEGLVNRYICYDEDWRLLYKDGTFSLYEKVNNDQE